MEAILDKSMCFIEKIKLESLFNESKKIKAKDILLTKNKIKKNLNSVSKLNQKELDKSISIFHGLEKIKKLIKV